MNSPASKYFGIDKIFLRVSCIEKIFPTVSQIFLTVASQKHVPNNYTLRKVSYQLHFKIANSSGMDMSVAIPLKVIRNPMIAVYMK